MLNEMENFASVEGILSEIDLKKEVVGGADVIRGSVTVRVAYPDHVCEVPVQCYAKRKTNAGNDNPSYLSMSDLIDNGKSIAAVGEENAWAIRVGGANISMQEYVGRDGRQRAYPCVRGSFFNQISANEMKPQANGHIEVAIAKCEMQLDKDNVPTDTLQITGIHVGYGEYVNIIPFITRNPKYIDAIKATYSEGDVVKMKVELNFTATTEIVIEEMEIGDPIETPKTKRVSEIVITGLGGSQYAGGRLEASDMNHLIDSHTARISKRAEKSRENNTDSRDKAKEQAKASLGF